MATAYTHRDASWGDVSIVTRTRHHAFDTAPSGAYLMEFASPSQRSGPRLARARARSRIDKMARWRRRGENSHVAWTRLPLWVWPQGDVQNSAGRAVPQHDSSRECRAGCYLRGNRCRISLWGVLRRAWSEEMAITMDRCCGCWCISVGASLRRMVALEGSRPQAPAKRTPAEDVNMMRQAVCHS